MNFVSKLIICAVYAVLLIVYCAYEKKDDFKTATALKVILSAIASGLCFYAAIFLHSTVMYIFATGMLCAVPADYYLQFIKLDIKKYRIGIFFFGAMHFFILISYFMKWGVHYYEFVILVLLLAILLIFQNKQHWKMGPERAQLTVYTLFVALMAAKSMSLLFIEVTPYTIAAATGGLCFFASDVFLGVWNYYRDKFVFLAANRAIYFTGQMALAFYLVLMPR